MGNMRSVFRVNTKRSFLGTAALQWKPGADGCRSSSTFARNASTSSKRSSWAKTKLPARSVRARSSHPSYRYSPCPRKAALHLRELRGRAVPVAIRADRDLARWTTNSRTADPYSSNKYQDAAHHHLKGGREQGCVHVAVANPGDHG